MDLVSSSILGPVCERVIDAALEEYTLVRDVKKEIKNLASTVSAIKGVLQDAENKQVENDAVSTWLQLLKQILFDAEDVLDEIATDEALRRTDAGGTSRSVTTSKRAKVCNTIRSLLCGSILHGHTVAHKIQDIRKRIDFISAEKDKLGLLMLRGGVSSSSDIRTNRRLETSSLLGNEPHIIGRCEDEEKIERLLLLEESAEGSANNHLHVITVVGMGGIGKTTLVKHVYNNPAVEQCFKTKMWVCVSNDFDVKRITREIMEGVCNSEEVKEFNGISNWDVAQKRLQGKLEGKRFLLVLDDVWEKDRSKWESLCTPLMCGGKGSKIVVTTRSQEVADVVKGTRISLTGLSDENLWVIFERDAFDNCDLKKRRQLERVGREIVGKLKGLPLAAKTIGRLLNKNLDLEHWRSVLKAKAWLSLQSGEYDILGVLKLSYDYLPGRLKQCFAYCSLFPEDYRFDRDVLVQLWTAQQFIEHHVECNIGGDECFDGLIHASLLEPYMYEGPYVMHDLIQNLAEKVSKDNCFRLEGKNFEGNSETIRHVSIATESFDPTEFNELCKFENTRTLLFLRGCSFQLDPHHLDELFTKLQRLRVLGLRECEIEELPTSIGTLKHLRYLDLSWTRISKLPKSLCKLLNLQVLKLTEVKIEELPTSIGALKHLWYLDLSKTRINKLSESLCNLLNLQVLNLRGCDDLGSLPENMGALINLRHLYERRSLVSSIRGLGGLTALQELFDFDCRRQKMRELADMDVLRQLTISSLEEVKSKEEASESRLDMKVYLEELEMSWSSTTYADSRSSCDHEEVLRSLEPPSSSLRRLTIVNYGGIRSPGWMDDQSWLSSSSSLESLELQYCRNWEVLPPLGQLPCLSFLHIRGMRKVGRLGPRFMGCCYAEKGGVLVGVPGGGGFPLLEELRFEDMGEWEEWEAPPVPQQQQQQQQYRDQYDDRTIINDDDDDRLRQMQPQQQQQQPLPHPQQQIITLLPRLRTLVIERCPKLRQLPPLPPTLTWLELSRVGLTHLPGWLPPSSISSSSSSPSPALSSLRIERCPNLASLTGGLLRHPDLHNLRKLEIWGCQDLVSLPEETALGHLTSLEELSLRDCPKLSRPPTSSVEHPLPSSLKRLCISGCNEEVGDVLLAPGGSQYLTSLTDMTIVGRCRFGWRKRSAGQFSTSDDSNSGTPPPPPPPPLSPSLWKLTISSNDELDDECLSTWLRGLTSLGHLSISDCPVITSLPRAEALSHLTALQSLSIRSSRGLKSLGGIHSLVSLQSLTMHDCPQLQDIATVISTSTSTTTTAAAAAAKPLRSLEIGRSSVQQMKAWLLRCPSLQELKITGCPQLSGFGTGGRGGSASLLEMALLERLAPTLRQLAFGRCENLRSLPPNFLRCLSSLESLVMDDCPRIPSLPAGGLPESLRRLIIIRCPALEERCRRGEGADWHLISHIGDLYIA